MLINNKYNLGEEVYYIDIEHRSIVKGKIVRLHIDFRGAIYDVEAGNIFKLYDYVREDFIWKSVEECKQYILENIEELFNFQG